MGRHSRGEIHQRQDHEPLIPRRPRTVEVVGWCALTLGTTATMAAIGAACINLNEGDVHFDRAERLPDTVAVSEYDRAVDHYEDAQLIVTIVLPGLATAIGGFKAISRNDQKETDGSFDKDYSSDTIT